MTKSEFKQRLEALGLTQRKFFELAKTSSKVASNYRDEDEMPGIYEAFVGLLEEIHSLKNMSPENIPSLEFLQELNAKIETFLKDFAVPKTE